MLKVIKSIIGPGRVRFYDSNTKFETYDIPYPIIEIKSCHYTVKLQKIGDYPHAIFDIKAELVLEDSYDLVHFDDTITVHEEVDILDEEDQIGSGIIYPGNDIDLDECALLLIESALPIAPRRKGSKLPESGDGYEVKTLEQDIKEQELAAEEEYNPAFDKLADLDFDD